MIDQKVCRTLDGQQLCFYVDRITGHHYSRVLIGMSWPGQKPGYLVVVGKDRHKTGGIRPMRALFEMECRTVQELCAWANVARTGYRAGEIFGDPTNEPMVCLWGNYCAYKNTDFYPCPAPQIQFEDKRWPYYLSLVQSCLLPGKNGEKALIIGDCQQLRAALSSLQAESVKENIADHPQIAALGFAVAAFREVYPDPDDKRPAPMANLDVMHPMTGEYQP
jgi:hypothetical protein